MGLHLCFEGAWTKAGSQRSGDRVGDLFDEVRTEGGEFVAKRTTLDQAERGVASGAGVTPEGNGLERGRSECGFVQVALDEFGIEVPKGRAGDEGRRMVAQEVADRLHDGARKLVEFETIPHREEEVAAGFENAPRFPIGGDFVWKEHCAELANDTIEGLIGEWELSGIGLAEGDAFVGESCGVVEHGRIQVGGNHGNRRSKRSSQGTGENASAGGKFKQIAGGELGEARSEIVGIGLEKERTHVAFVELRDRALEFGVSSCHRKF